MCRSKISAACGAVGGASRGRRKALTGNVVALLVNIHLVEKPPFLPQVVLLTPYAGSCDWGSP